MVWEYIHRYYRTHMLSTLISWFCCFHQDHLLDRHYNNVAEIMSSVCDWARLGLCQKPQGPASLIKCMKDMAATAFSITCASVFGRVMMRMSAKHMATESIAHITIQLCPRASIMQTLVLLPIFSMDSANQQLRQCPQLLLPHLFPPWGI